MRASTPMVYSSRAAALAALLLTTHAHAGEPSTRSPELQELFRQADEAALKRLDGASARELWAQIYRLEPSTAALCQLGQLDRRLGRWEEAAAELAMCVERMPAPKNLIERRRYEVRHADFAAVQQHVSELHVIPPPRAIEVLVDGKEVDATKTLYVAPGQHEVTATGPQGQVTRTLVHLTAGQSARVPLTFEAQPAHSTTSITTAPPASAWLAPPRGRAGPRPWILEAGTSAAVILLGTGIGLHVAASSSDHDAEAKKDNVPRESIDPSDAEYKAIYEQAMAAHERANTLHSLGSATLIAGAALGAATLVCLALPHNAVLRARAGGAEVRWEW